MPAGPPWVITRACSKPRCSPPMVLITAMMKGLGARCGQVPSRDFAYWPAPSMSAASYYSTGLWLIPAGVSSRVLPPLPLTGGRRSMVHVEAVVEAALRCAVCDRAAGSVYTVTDGRAYQTREICEWIYAVLGRRAPTWSVPARLLRTAALAGDALGGLLGRSPGFDSAAYDRLLGTAVYESDLIVDRLGFRSRYDLQSAMPSIVSAVLAETRG